MLADEQVLFLQPGAGVSLHADEEISPWFSQRNLRKEKKVGSPWEMLPSVTLVSCHWLFTDSPVLVVTSVKNWVLWGSLIILEHFLGAISLYIVDISSVHVCAQSFSHGCLCDHMDYSPQGSSDRGIFQASIPEQVAISYSRAPSWPRDQTFISCISCTGTWILYH